MVSVPKKQDYRWGYEILWSQSPISQNKILHINSQQTFTWKYQKTKAEAVHCLFGSLFIVNDQTEIKIWPGESYQLDDSVLAIKAGHEAAEVLFSSVSV